MARACARQLQGRRRPVLRTRPAPTVLRPDLHRPEPNAEDGRGRRESVEDAGECELGSAAARPPPPARPRLALAALLALASASEPGHKDLVGVTSRSFDPAVGEGSVQELRPGHSGVQETRSGSGSGQERRIRPQLQRLDLATATSRNASICCILLSPLRGPSMTSRFGVRTRLDYLESHLIPLMFMLSPFYSVGALFSCKIPEDAQQRKLLGHPWNQWHYSVLLLLWLEEVAGDPRSQR